MSEHIIDRLEIVNKLGKRAYVIFPSFEKQKQYVKAEQYFCKAAYIDYCGAFTLVARKRTKEALDKQRRLFAETQQYAPSKKNPEYWIFHPKMEKVRA